MHIGVGEGKTTRP